ncbi:MAG: serine/threonine-protein kinase [Planctomycetota bacterium]|nr:serine/threonine-protein kinase [Planctomycetota bacterium]
MVGSVSDEALARYLNQIGLAALDKIEAAQQEQAEAASKGVSLSLADVLVKKGVINAEQRDNIEKKLKADQDGGARQLGPYKLLKKLGEGGMGAVYLADDTSVGRKVAVKVLPKKYSEEREFLTRFRREAQATGRLNHVNIVMAYNVGEDAGTHYYAMEYCEGETLDQILKRDKVIPWDAAVGVVLQVARGLKRHLTAPWMTLNAVFLHPLSVPQHSPNGKAQQRAAPVARTPLNRGASLLRAPLYRAFLMADRLP